MSFSTTALPWSFSAGAGRVSAAGVRCFECVSVEVVEGIPRLTWEWIWMASIKRGGLVSGSVGCLYDRETRGRKRRAIGVSLFPVLAGVR